MSYPSSGVAATSRPRVLSALLDPAFGLFVWAAHLLIVYVASALSCALGLSEGNGGSHTILQVSLALVTLTAVALLVGHALRRYRALRTPDERRFRLPVTIGLDAIAIFTIVGQFLPVLLVPRCA